MPKFRWYKSMKMFRDLVDPVKEEQLKWTILETGTKVTRVVKLIKGIFGNREIYQKKRSEAIHLIEDFHGQYQSMCAMYEDLKEGVKKKCNNEEDKEDNESSSASSSNSLSMESAGYFSTGTGSKTPSLDNIPKATTTDGQSMKSENSCYSLEDMGSEVVKEASSVEPVWSSYKPEEKEEEEKGRTVEKLMQENGDLRNRLGEKENKYQNLENKSSTRMKELEDRVVSLKLEIEELHHREQEEESKGRHDYNVHKNDEKQIESAFKEKEGVVLKKLEECEKILNSKIDHSMDRVKNIKSELDTLRFQNDEDRRKLLYEKEKELECLRIRNHESELEIKEKTEEIVDEFEKNLKGKIVKSMDRVQNVQTEVNTLRKKILYEKEKQRESSRIRNEESEMEIKNKMNEVVDECEKILEGKIVQSLDRVQNMQMEVDALRFQNVEARMKLYERERELERLRIQNEESEIELKKKSKEAADSLEVLESLAEKLKQTTMNEEELNQQVRDSAVMIARINVENEKQQTTISQLNDENVMQKTTISHLNDQKEKQQTTISQLNDESEKQKATISQLNDLNEKQKAKISQLNDENEKQKTKISQINDENEKLKITISQINDENGKRKATISQLNDEKERQKTKISQINDENEKRKTTISRLNDENEKRRATISQLEEKLRSKETQISTAEAKSESVKKELLNKMKSLEQKFKNLEIDKKELEGKNDVLAGTLEQRDLLVDKLNDEARSNFQASVKKMGEMMDEFRKNSEDNIRLLSRRIRVAETLQNEGRDWYKKTKDKVEQDKLDTDTNVRTIKLLMTMVNETLKITESLGLRFVECCEDFMNRVSKVSCEINSAKDWVRRKKVKMVQVKEGFDALVVELDGKEEEVLRSRKKVLKLENKLRDLEKTVKENDETIIVLKEEKREAIRHLCVWTDYHRSRADFLTKSLSDLLARNHRPV